jgi:phosphatidylserine/phosphatidylglycerophosphate/cardiolipin synthase-like enzyme
MTAPPRALSSVSTADLERLLAAVERESVACPLSEAGLRAAGFGASVPDLLGTLAGLGRSGAQAALRAALAERAHRPPPHLDLVWTGPEARSSTTRDTAVVVRRLFESARESVLVGGFRFDHGAELLEPLHAAMLARGVRARFFLDVEGAATHASDADRYATEKLDRFLAENWPFGAPRPELYYDPRTAAPGPPWVSLHAKCVVVDERQTLIGSANFTRRGQEFNVEAGVLIDDAHFARHVVAQWWSLVEARIMKRYDGGS